MAFGYYIECVDSKGNDGEWNGNVKTIRVRKDEPLRECVIRLKPRKYGKEELLYMIVNKIG